MTREEAAAIIRKYDANGCGYCHQGGDEIEEAFDMAIKALEQEPYDDAINRIFKMAKFPTYEEIGKKVAEEALDGYIYEGKTLREWIDILKQTRWIPVSERLPQDKTYVLTTIYIPGRQPHARSGWYQDELFHNDNGDTWKATDIEVTAWTPLPTPYKAGDN